MNQKLSLSLFFSGLATFLMSLAEFFSGHDTWDSLSTPSSVAHIMTMTASFVVTIVGALGTSLPRKKNGRISDRIPKEDIVVNCIEEEK